jgi:methylenetetrahydrofolate--tRNA-(uracil-5-)-methyltransferase
MNVNYGLFPPLEGRQRKRSDRRLALAERALAEITPWWGEISAPRAPC